MTATFTTAAGQLAGLAGRALGWRPDEFWRATPAELAVILAPLASAGAGAERINRAEIDQLMERER